MTEIAWSDFETKLRAYVRHLIPNSWADDVVSDILLRLFHSQNKMEGATNTLAWVYRVAANVITDHYRKAARQKKILDGVKLDQPASVSPARQNDDTTSLASCLIPMIKDLPAPYHDALMLTEIDGMARSITPSRGSSVVWSVSSTPKGRKIRTSSKPTEKKCRNRSSGGRERL